MTERILLIGMMGAGKTTVGRALAVRLGWTYLDSDEQVRAATGCTVKEIFTEEGPASLHRYEGQALIDSLERPTSSVISVAGGVLLAEGNRVLLRRERHVVWLRASIDTLTERIGTTGARPYFDADHVATIGALDEVRRPLYAQVADVTIDVDDATPEEIVDRILAAVQLQA